VAVVGLLGACSSPAQQPQPTEATGTPTVTAAPITDEVMAGLGKCIVEAFVAQGSEPERVEVYTTTWAKVGEATGAAPGDGSVEQAVYFLWVTGDLKPFGGPSAVSPPSGSGEMIGQWLVEPIQRPAQGPPYCAGNYAGGVYEVMPADLAVLGPATVMPSDDYAVTASRSS
jgi:hypothetical protein